MISSTNVIDHSLKRERTEDNAMEVEDIIMEDQTHTKSSINKEIDRNFPMFQNGKGNRHFLSFSPYTPMNPSKFGSCEDVNQAKLFLSSAPELKDVRSRNRTVNSSEKRPLFGIQRLTSLNQIVYINCVFGELVVLFESNDEEVVVGEEKTTSEKNLILYHVGKFSNVNNISEHTTTITEIPLPMLPIFSGGDLECGSRKLTREDVVFFSFSCDYQRRVYFIQFRNGKVFARGTNSFNELGLPARCNFVEDWKQLSLTEQGEHVTTIKTNSHTSVFGTQNGKWYLCGKDAFFLKKRIIDFDDVQIDFLEADELDSPFICSIEIPNETIVSVQQLFVGSFLVTKSGKVYSTFRERLSIITDYLNENSSNSLQVNYLLFNQDGERTENNHPDTLQRECFLLNLPFPISEIRAIDNSMLITREEDKRLFVSKKSNLIDLEISDVRRIINTTDEFFIVSKGNNIYSLYPSASIPTLKAIELPRELKQVSVVRPTKLRKPSSNPTQSSSSASKVSSATTNAVEEPVYNLWESCDSLEIRNILNMTTTFFVIVVEEAKGQVNQHFLHSMQNGNSLILSDMDIITQK